MTRPLLVFFGNIYLMSRKMNGLKGNINNILDYMIVVKKKRG